MNRRQFFKSASALALAAHEGLALSSPQNATRIATNDAPRLLRLRLLTAAPLAKMKSFYHDLLGLPLIEEKTEEFTFAGGQTAVTFAQAQPEHGKPFYHVAFNIPENKIRGAHDWQKPRTPLDRLNASLRDPEMPEDVVHFRHWNAHSIFFWDPAGNLIEYIARHDLQNGAAGSFSIKDILYASEIGFISEDVTNTALEMKKALQLEQYRGGDGNFRALGDEHGLLLVIIRGRRWGYEEKAPPTSIFPTVAEIRGTKPTQFAVAGHPYEIFVK
ncbi:MAG: VOC family protein [bacterium]